jgi:hypothetical protein
MDEYIRQTVVSHFVRFWDEAQEAHCLRYSKVLGLLPQDLLAFASACQKQANTVPFPEHHRQGPKKYAQVLAWYQASHVEEHPLVA